MKKKTAFVLAFAMLLCVITGYNGASAAGNVIFIAVENVFERKLGPTTMPAVSDGVIYVPYTALYGLTGVKTYYNTKLQQIIVYNINSRLTFDLASNQTYDLEGNSYTQTAKQINGITFVPAKLVCDKFDMFYAYITTGVVAPVVRMNTEYPEMSNTYFINSVSFLMQSIYDEYQESLKQPETPPVTEPDVTVPTTEEQVRHMCSLLFEGLPGDDGETLELLSEYRYNAGFFVTAEEMLQNADGLRRAYGDGHAIGLRIDPEGKSDEQLLSQLNEDNEVLSAIIGTKTRLVCVAGGANKLEQSRRDALINSGFRLWDGTADPYTGKTGVYTSVKNVLSKTSKLTALRLVCDENTQSAMPRILSWLKGESYSVIAINEWTTPINRAGDIR